MAFFVNVSQQSPGVIDILRDSSQFTPQVSETKAAIIGVANKGPIGVPTLLTSQADFIDTFEIPSLNGYGGLAAYNLLGQINQVYFTRIATSSAKASSGNIVAPAAGAEITGSNFAKFSFGFGQTNNQFLLGIDSDPVKAIEFEEGTITTDDIITTLSAVFLGVATIEKVSGLIRITSLSEGSGSKIVIPNSDARSTLGFNQATVVGTDATSAFITSTNATGVFPGSPFSSVSSLHVRFDDDVNLTVNLTGSFIDGINNIPDLVEAFNNFAGNNVDVSLANSAIVDQEKIRFVSPTAGADSVVHILSTTTNDVVTTLGLSGVLNIPTSGNAATSATVLNTLKEGYDLSSQTTLKFIVDAIPEKTINFAASGAAAYSTVTYTSGVAISTGLDVLVDDWTFHFESVSGNLNSTTKEFDVAVGASSVDSWSNLSDAINLYADEVVSVHDYNSGTLSGTLTVTAVDTGSAGNGIVFNTTEVAAFFNTKNPTDNTLGYGNGNVISDLSAATIDKVVKEINRQAGSIYAFQDDGKISIKSETTGDSSQVKITGTNTSIGMVSGDIDNGENVRNIFSITAITTGTWGDDISVETGDDGLVTVSIDDAIAEQWSGTTISALDTFIETVVNGNSEIIQLSYLGDIGEEIPAGLSVQLANGDSGPFVSDQDVVNAIKLHENKELIDISLFATPGYSSTAVLTELDRIARVRQDAFFLIDPPVGYTPTQVVNWHNGVAGSGNTFKLDNTYMGLYYPWIRTNDRLNGVTRLVPPSVLILELMAKNDREQQPYTAPAGPLNGKLNRAQDLEISPSLADRELMLKTDPANAVNPIINSLGRGIIIFGQKTLQRELTSLNRINVSRLLIYIRRRIRDIALDITFQPNDPITWNIFVSQTTKFLQTVVAERGIVEFRVVMDETTNTNQTISEGKLFGFIQIKPRLVAEQIILTFEVVGQDFVFTDAV